MNNNYSSIIKNKSVVTIIDTTDGKQKILERTHNATILPGRFDALEKLFVPASVASIDASQHYTMKQILSNTLFPYKPVTGIQDDDLDLQLLDNRKCQNFTIGNGGLRVNPLVESRAIPYESRLYNMVPFRCIEYKGVDTEDDVDRTIYKMRVICTLDDSKQYVCYFAKKFDINSVNDRYVNIRYANGEVYSPKYEDSVPNYLDTDQSATHPLENTSIHLYVDFDLIISETDFKEFYKIQNSGSLDGAYLSEFSTLLSNEKSFTDAEGTTYDELYNVELFSKVCHSPSYMNREKNSRRISYQIFS